MCWVAAEWALWCQWSVRAEHLFYHLNTATGVVVDESTGNFPSNPTVFSWNNTEIQLVRVEASYKFCAANCCTSSMCALGQSRPSRSRNALFFVRY
jgi:hypothetical protein